MSNMLHVHHCLVKRKKLKRHWILENIIAQGTALVTESSAYVADNTTQHLQLN